MRVRIARLAALVDFIPVFEDYTGLRIHEAAANRHLRISLIDTESPSQARRPGHSSVCIHPEHELAGWTLNVRALTVTNTVYENGVYTPAEISLLSDGAGGGKVVVYMAPQGSVWTIR